jgi:hypothetical protein
MKINYLVNLGGMITQLLNYNQMEQIVTQLTNQGVPKEAINIYTDIELEESEYEITDLDEKSVDK